MRGFHLTKTKVMAVVGNWSQAKKLWKKKLDWSSHMDSLFKNGTEPTVLFKETQILPRHWAPLPSTPCQTALTTALFFGVMKWGDGSHTADRNRINKLIINLSSRLHHGINKRKKKTGGV